MWKTNEILWWEDMDYVSLLIYWQFVTFSLDKIESLVILFKKLRGNFCKSFYRVVGYWFCFPVLYGLAIKYFWQLKINIYRLILDTLDSYVIYWNYMPNKGEDRQTSMIISCQENTVFWESWEKIVIKKIVWRHGYNEMIIGLWY